MLHNIFIVSLSMSAVILLILAISPRLNKRYAAKCTYFIWLFIALRLLVPFHISVPDEMCIRDSLIREHLYHHIFFYKFERVAKLLRIKRHKLKRLLIHKIVQIAVRIRILHILTLNVRLRHFFCRPKRPLYNAARNNIIKPVSYTHLDVYKRKASQRCKKSACPAP